jgi:hypothetical protein
MNPLTDKTKPHGKITFIHSDGKEHSFYSCVNSLSGSRLCAFDNDPPSIDQTMKYIRSVFSDIVEKSSNVIRYEGTKHFMVKRYR